jgi:hypothetical protein
MWNVLHLNRICHIQDKIREQRLHLERVITMKPVIDVEEPITPSFLKTRLAKKEMEEEKLSKIEYENRLMFRKILETNIHPGQYNLNVLAPEIYPAFKKKKNFRYSDLKRQYDINKSNFDLYSRISTLKPTYDNRNIVRDAIRNYKFRENISKSKNIQNPYLNFDSPEEFRRKLEIQMMNSLMERKRPKSSFPTTNPNEKNNNKTTAASTKYQNNTTTNNNNMKVTQTGQSNNNN